MAVSAAAVADGARDAGRVEMRSIPAGRYVPLYGEVDAVTVAPFWLDRFPVTNADFLAFVRNEPHWQRGGAPKLFADEDYLSDWAGPTEIGSGAEAPLPDAPVTAVSWFAARAYCEAHGKRLPTLDEWEFVALADTHVADGTADPAFHQRILGWYARPRQTRLPPVGSTFRNVYGVDDVHGLVWEWVEDFGSVFVTGESRGDGSIDRELYCAASGAGSSDPRNYAAFLRYAMRASLEARFALRTLGFRCARDAS